MRIILYPISLIYGFITYLRNKLYDSGTLKSTKLSVPVISVGNITTGGTGKTPLTVYLAEYYMQKGRKVGIVSRGYGRNSSFQLLVCDGEKILDNVDMTGDELYMISEELLQKYSNFHVLADSNRVKGAEYLIDKYNPDVIILDDAFQHRKIQRDLDIVMIDSGRYDRLFNKILLPAGNLRESRPGLKRADIIIQNNKRTDKDELEGLSSYEVPIVMAKYKMEGLYDKNNQRVDTIQKNVLALSSIANTDSFYKTINDLGLNIVHKFKYVDHYGYINKDIHNITETANQGLAIVTTHKDMVKLREFDSLLSNYKIYYIKIGLTFDKNYNILEQKLNELID